MKIENNINSVLNKILKGDNKEILKSFPDKSVDLIFADPPYNMNLSKDLFRPNGDKFKGVNDEWDKYTSLEKYDLEAKEWLFESLRILKDSGSLWVIGSFHNIHRLGYILQDMGAWIINEIVWNKTNPVPNFAGTRFVNSQETLLWVVKNKKSKYTFNYKTMKYINGGKQMKSVWNISICSGNERLKNDNGSKIHSTQKPLNLLNRIILSTSNYNDIVLDPFSGTGTTAHSAKLWGRKFIGIEKDENYIINSLKRLSLVEESEDHILKFASLDKKQPLVSFKDLMENKILKENEKVTIKDEIFYFNSDATIAYKESYFSPNKLCKLIFGKPTNAWKNIKLQNGDDIDSLREYYRKGLTC